MSDIQLNERSKKLIEALKEISTGMVFISMPITSVTPAIMLDTSKTEEYKTDEPFIRRHGIFTIPEAALSPFDHGNLYGDGVFEGILIKHGIIFKHREHMKRFERSAKLKYINIPYTHEALTKELLKGIKKAKITENDTAYIRLVITRGIGTLGVNPDKCIGPTVYAIISKIQLYPPQAYEKGIGLGVARKIRRGDASFNDPTIKSLNYANNIDALIEGALLENKPNVLETIMMTKEGYVAEATADNIFLVEKNEGNVKLTTPVDEYCLNGITRGVIFEIAKEFGYKVEKSDKMMLIDFIGKNKECFLTGTGCGIMPIIEILGNEIGNGKPGEITKKIIERYNEIAKDKQNGLPINASEEEIEKYFS